MDVFLMVCTGESYSTHLVAEDRLVEMLACVLYSSPDEMPAAEREEWKKRLEDPGEWCGDPDAGRTSFHAEIGEVDSISLYRLEGVAAHIAEAGIERMRRLAALMVRPVLARPSALLPCPFCGANIHVDHVVSRAGGLFDVVCPECIATGPLALSKELAIRTWNVRPPVAANPSNEQQRH